MASMKLGLLFDLDGTMAETDPVHFEAFNALLGEFGRSLTLDAYRSEVIGGANPVIMKRLFPDFTVERHVELADRKESLFRSMTATLEPLPGLRELVAWAEEQGVPCGAVTNAPRLNAEHMLQTLGFEHLLADVVVGEEVERSKPDPLPYLVGLERLGCPAERAVAFEDSRAGVRAASAAGIFTVGMRTSLDEPALLEAGASLTVADYRDPLLLSLLNEAREGGPIRRPG
jgi:HAD superfamily hydrolase (TIGR01509 family)